VLTWGELSRKGHAELFCRVPMNTICRFMQVRGSTTQNPKKSTVVGQRLAVLYKPASQSESLAAKRFKRTGGLVGKIVELISRLGEVVLASDGVWAPPQFARKRVTRRKPSARKGADMREKKTCD